MKDKEAGKEERGEEHKKGDYERVEIRRAVGRKRVDVDVEMCMEAKLLSLFPE